ncbi:uncharacterized protein LOC125648180 [Ostrea edulis]|uniref:uncharacterized protein LOC125648180 n=1 Tax=Ostrea edulis TaxID=37623 RepID=UPI00209557B0|nr:uncharacterized protein LOC125648180 [Ostrea edulis]XP_048731097.1 uncharacterized protein LOC125648180 [Ostrea edulis]XP_055998445.1 uncharacterized protein LOC125648180 [Ostrea edulis]XP_055998446.1 uncharacterized protein LOC125648180 [Ostrea edulis]
MYHWNYFWTFLIYINFTLATSSGNTQRTSEATNLIEAFDRATREIRSARASIQEVQRESNQLQTDMCRFGAANNHACGIAIFDSRNPGRREEELDNLDMKSPKRETKSFKQRRDNPQTEEERIAYIAKLAKRRQDMDKILELLDEKEKSIKVLKKRTCAVELGGACRTEWASAIADQYYYLMGPHGPGKRRRRRSLYNVLTGKLSHISSKN